MKAVRIHQQGGPENLIYEELPMPEPGEGQARIKVEAIGVNYVDIYQRSGLYPLPTPFVTGSEAAGIVDAIGSGIREVKVGDRVAYAMERGSYTEHVVVPAWKLVQIPDAVSAQAAAAVMLQGLTAHYLSYSTYPIQSSEWALVHAAAGGVGLLLTQLVKQRGAHVIGTVSTDEKAELARQAGADEVILYMQADFEAETKRITDGKGVHVVYDSVGKDTFDKSLKCLRPRGYMVLYGQSSGKVAPFDPLELDHHGSLFLTRPSLRHHTSNRAELLQRAGELFEMMAAGKLDVRIDKTFALADAAKAHRYMEARKSKGKVLLIP